MKKQYFIFFALMVIALSFGLTSCESDTFYEDDPSDTRNEYVGVWRFTEGGYKNGLSQSYIVTIALDPDNSSQVLLDNFGNPGNSDITVTGIVTTNSIVVSSQTLPNGWIVEGTGKKEGTSQMNWTYSITAGGDKEYYTATASRQ